MADTDRKTPGPKAVDPDHPINTSVSVTCSTAQKKRWGREAKALGLSRGAYVRGLAERGEA